MSDPNGKTTVEACDIDYVGRLSKDPANKHGVVVVFTQEKCEPCSPFTSRVRKLIGDRIPVIESSIEDKKCLDMALSFDVKGTPTAVLVKDGVEQKRVTLPKGQGTWESVGDDIRKLIPVEEPSPQPA